MDSAKESKKILDENQPEDEEDLLCDSDSDDTSSDDSDDATLSDTYMEDSQNNTLTSQQKPFDVMSEADIRQAQECDITKISDVLSISRVDAAILLLRFNWNVNVVPEEWFTKGQKLREELGLFDSPVDVAESSNATDKSCGICWKTFSQDLVTSPCGHIFCNTCWAEYIGSSLKDGPPCLFLQCPATLCNAAVGQDMINMLASDDDKERYAHYFLRSYIDFNPKANWCPAPGCKYAVILLSGNSNSNVTCKCGYGFCWKCTKEAHQPVSCATLANWVVEGFVQSENWTIANTKGCPRCRRSLEMNAQFKRIECPTCKYHFCKVCRASWLDHGFWEGDQYTHLCSKGKQILNPEETEDSTAEEHRKVAQDCLVRYRNSQAQWMYHDLHLQAAIKEIQKLNNGQLKEIADKQGLTEAEISFISEAWMQISDCKRVLKWTCVYEYYLLDLEKEKKYLLNYMLRRAEVVMEQLYQCAAQVKTLSNMEEPSLEFLKFHDPLSLKTRVARNYFANMVWAIDNRLSDLNSLRQIMSSRWLQLEITTPVAGMPGSSRAEGSPENADLKLCDHCHFHNDVFASICVMCYH